MVISMIQASFNLVEHVMSRKWLFFRLLGSRMDDLLTRHFPAWLDDEARDKDEDMIFGCLRSLRMNDVHEQLLHDKHHKLMVC
jgi:hypothetical protein